MLTVFFFHVLFLSDLFSDNDFWFPLNSSASGPVPPCAGGHSATYDPNSKSVFVYGGLREGQRYSELYILDTLTWSWRLVNVGCFLLCFFLLQHVVFSTTFNTGEGNCFSSFFVLPTYRPEEMSQNWHTTLQPFTRRSFLSLAESSRAIPPEINPAVMLCTSSTQSMNSGTSPSWRGTDLCRALGQSFLSSRAKVHSILNQVLYFSLTKNPYCV